MEITIKGWQCERCGWIWMKVTDRVPTHCAHCHSRQWNARSRQAAAHEVQPDLRADRSGGAVPPSLRGLTGPPGGIALVAAGLAASDTVKVAPDRGDRAEAAYLSSFVVGASARPEEAREFARAHPEIAYATPRNSFMDDDAAGPTEELCRYYEDNLETGERVYCALPQHTKKVPHVPGRRETLT